MHWNEYFLLCIPCLCHYLPIIYTLGDEKLKNIQYYVDPFNGQHGRSLDIWGTDLCFVFVFLLKYNLPTIKFTLFCVHTVLWVFTNIQLRNYHHNQDIDYFCQPSIEHH